MTVLNALKAVIPVIFILMMVSTGCSSQNPAMPDELSSPRNVTSPAGGERMLLAYGYVDIDPASMTATFIPMRESGFHINATALLEKDFPYSITPQPLDLDADTGELAVRVTLHHPEQSPVFLGFDVRGIVFSKVSDTTWTDSSLVMQQDGDAIVLRNPNGYTRWWNPSEFSGGVNPIRTYVDGQQGSKYTGMGNYDYNGTLNPYMYFTPGHPDAFDTGDPFNLANSLDLDALFNDAFAISTQFAISPDSTCSRIYQFNIGAGFLNHFGFNYAIDASWALPSDLINPTLEDFPPRAHMVEPFYLDVQVESNGLYFLDDTTNGGILELLVRVWDWQNYDETGFFAWNTPSDGVHGALSVMGRNGFMSDVSPTVEYVSDDPSTRSVTYRVTITDPAIPGIGLYDLMLIAEHSRTYPAVFAAVDDVFLASYHPFPNKLVVLPIVPEPFELPYDDPMDPSTDNFWQMMEYEKSPPYQPVAPQPDWNDTNNYHWGVSDAENSWSSQVHESGGEQVQDMNGYKPLMRNGLISPSMIFPAIGSVKLEFDHTFSMEPFDDFGEVVFIWEDGLNWTYHPMFFYHFTGELPGNTSGISDGTRHDIYHFDRLTSLNGSVVETFTPTPGGSFRIGFIFDSDADNSDPFLGWELDHVRVTPTIPWSDAGMVEFYQEHFDATFATQSMWTFADMGSSGEFWGLSEIAIPGGDGTFLDAAQGNSSIYGTGWDEEAILLIDLPPITINGQIIMELRHRMAIDPGTCAFIAINGIDGDDPNEEYEVLHPCYAGGLFPYVFTRGTTFAGVIDPGGNNNVTEGWGHFCWTGVNPGGFTTMESMNEEISSYFDLTQYSGQQVMIRFVFRSGNAIVDPFFPFMNTLYATWLIEELTIKSS